MSLYHHIPIVDYIWLVFSILVTTKVEFELLFFKFSLEGLQNCFRKVLRNLSRSGTEMSGTALRTHPHTTLWHKIWTMCKSQNRNLWTRSGVPLVVQSPGHL